MSEAEIERKFQLLKKDSSGNHNLLKSRACEFCIKNHKRGTPLGIQFYYHGDEKWPSIIQQKGKRDALGAVGTILRSGGRRSINDWVPRTNHSVFKQFNTSQKMILKTIRHIRYTGDYV
jgi:hypothetical protein